MISVRVITSDNLEEQTIVGSNISKLIKNPESTIDKGFKTTFLEELIRPLFIEFMELIQKQK